MAEFRIFETTPFQRDLKSVPVGERELLQERLKESVYPAIRTEPRTGPNIRKLRQWKPDTWRYRLGRWRLFYEIDDRDRLVLLTALHRRDDHTYDR